MLVISPRVIAGTGGPIRQEFDGPAKDGNRTITKANLDTIFNNGNRKLTRKTAAMELENTAAEAVKVAVVLRVMRASAPVPVPDGSSKTRCGLM